MMNVAERSGEALTVVAAMCYCNSPLASWMCRGPHGFMDVCQM